MDLLREDPVRLELELAKAGTTAAYLVRDARDVPVLRQRMKLLSSDDAKLRLALEWFGDQGHPQPKERTRPVRLVSSGGEPAFGSVTPDWERLPRLDSIESSTHQEPRPKKPRQRPPEPIEKETVERLKLELAQRKAKPRSDREFTQEKIAERVGLERNRVQQAEALERLGWDLLRTHPDFSADEGFVRWPTAAKAARILDSERAAN